MKNKKVHEKGEKLCLRNALFKIFLETSVWNKLRILFLEIKVSKQNFVSKYNIIFVKNIIKKLKI